MASTKPAEPSHLAVATTFETCFPDVKMCAGASEPLYEPPQGIQPARLHYREDFAASALHEAAHWCIAGTERRQQEDFGYVYLALPRTPAQQTQFFAAEARTQCLEALFAAVSGIKFQPSADNLEADLDGFIEALKEQQTPTRAWIITRAGHRARSFVQALAKLGRRDKDFWESADWIK
ncbi:MAG: elongation factor P hydroxylase [Pseudomonadota bacterium]